MKSINGYNNNNNNNNNSNNSNNNNNSSISSSSNDIDIYSQLENGVGVSFTTKENEILGEAVAEYLLKKPKGTIRWDSIYFMFRNKVVETIKSNKHLKFYNRSVRRLSERYKEMKKKK